MPRYDFKCECGNVFEKRCEIKKDGFGDSYISDENYPCPKCGKLAIRQFPRNVGFEFKYILNCKKHLKNDYF